MISTIASKSKDHRMAENPFGYVVAAAWVTGG
jgi:hypothetical protein